MYLKQTAYSEILGQGNTLSDRIRDVQTTEGDSAMKVVNKQSAPTMLSTEVNTADIRSHEPIQVLFPPLPSTINKTSSLKTGFYICYLALEELFCNSIYA
jgi:hypothetical protein